MCRMKRTKTLDIHLKEWGMEYHCNTCGTSKKTAKAMDAHILRCQKRNARKDKRKRRNQK